MLITKRRLPRRTFVRGLGVAVGLPFLDAMIPAAATAADPVNKPTARIAFVYAPNGMIMEQWTPKETGPNYSLTPILQPLAPFRKQILLISGLAHMEALALPGDNGGDHARASSSFLTGVHANKSEGAELRVGVSVDQIAGRNLAKHTQVASLELALDSNETLGECESGYSCAYTNTLSWRTPTTPIPMENHPRAVFENLFGDSESTDEKSRSAQRKSDRSILDFVLGGVDSLMTKVSLSDRRKVNEYLDAIRDVERRIQLAEAQSLKLPSMDKPVGIPATFVDHAKLMYDLQVLAFQSDLTRVSTFMTGHEQSNRSFPEIGVPDAHHSISHHGGSADKKAKIVQINTHQLDVFGYFLDRLQNTQDGDGTLLDHCAIVYGSGLSDGNLHTHDNLPLLLAGGGAGKVKGGRHIRVTEKTPMANLYATMLDCVGIPIEEFGTGAGKLEPLSVA